MKLFINNKARYIVLYFLIVFFLGDIIHNRHPTTGRANLQLLGDKN